MLGHFVESADETFFEGIDSLLLVQLYRDSTQNDVPTVTQQSDSLIRNNASLSNHDKLIMYNECVRYYYLHVQVYNIVNKIRAL